MRAAPRDGPDLDCAQQLCWVRARVSFVSWIRVRRADFGCRIELLSSADSFAMLAPSLVASGLAFESARRTECALSITAANTTVHWLTVAFGRRELVDFSHRCSRASNSSFIGRQLLPTNSNHSSICGGACRGLAAACSRICVRRLFAVELDKCQDPCVHPGCTARIYDYGHRGNGGTSWLMTMRRARHQAC